MLEPVQVLWEYQEPITPSMCFSRTDSLLMGCESGSYSVCTLITYLLACSLFPICVLLSLQLDLQELYIQRHVGRSMQTCKKLILRTFVRDYNTTTYPYLSYSHVGGQHNMFWSSDSHVGGEQNMFWSPDHDF